MPSLPAVPLPRTVIPISECPGRRGQARTASLMFSPSCLLADIGCLARDACLQGCGRWEPRVARWLWVTLRAKWSWGRGRYLKYGVWDWWYATLARRVTWSPSHSDVVMVLTAVINQ